MRRAEIVALIDGTHPRHGRGLACAHQVLIAVSCIAIAVETVPDLPAWARRGLLRLELVILIVFAAEYALRVVCAPRPLRYVASFWGLVDLISWLPLLVALDPEWLALRALRLMRLMRVLKLLHANPALSRLQRALARSRGELAVFAMLGAIVLYIAAVGIYIFEHPVQPEVFSSIPKSGWWAVVSFTTVGYGDMYPVTVGGRIFTALVLFVGLGVIAVPTAVITSALIALHRDDTAQERQPRHGTAQDPRQGDGTAGREDAPASGQVSYPDR